MTGNTMINMVNKKINLESNFIIIDESPGEFGTKNHEKKLIERIIYDTKKRKRTTDFIKINIQNKGLNKLQEQIKKAMGKDYVKRVFKSLIIEVKVKNHEKKYI